MDNVLQPYAVSTPPACIWSADDCYPVTVLRWLQQQAGQSKEERVVEPLSELEVV